MTRMHVFARSGALALLLASTPAFAGRGGIPGPGDDGFATGNPRAVGKCVIDFGGDLGPVDFCEYFGTQAAFPVRLEVVSAGSFWVPTSGGWWVNVPGGSEAIPLVYPNGYVSAYPNDPAEDFRSKIASVRVQIDPGTAREKNFVYTDPLGVVGYSTWGDLSDPTDPLRADWPGFHFNPTIMPLSIGEHRVLVYWNLSAEHCDGISTERDGSCLPAGEFCFRGCAGQFVFSFAPVSALP